MSAIIDAIIIMTAKSWTMRPESDGVEKTLSKTGFEIWVKMSDSTVLVVHSC
jgi:hypothetical protein